MREAVQDYYGNVVRKTEDLVYDACCTTDYDAQALAPLTDEVLSKRYGCGSPIPDAVFGKTVLDLGCGAGADVFITAQLVGATGKVIGVDMTDQQLEVARSNVDTIMNNIGYDRANVEFRRGEIESLDIEDDSIDCVISNCVINLSVDKTEVFNEIQRVLKPGGEFMIADIVADRRVPIALREDTTLYSECLTGADYEADFIRRMESAGFLDVRTVSRRSLKDRVGSVRFVSVTYRGFKVDLERYCEDYGQVAVYNGAIPGASDSYRLDRNHLFPAGQAVRICKNSADILKQSRLSEFFDVSDEISHLGRFDCSTPVNTERGNTESASSSCC